GYPRRPAFPGDVPMSPRTLTPLALALACLALAPAADKVSFHPADGSSASKTCSLSASFSLGDVSAMVDGQDMSEQIPSDGELGIDVKMGITDNYVRSDAGRPLELVRSFDD